MDMDMCIYVCMCSQARHSSRCPATLSRRASPSACCLPWACPRLWCTRSEATRSRSCTSPPQQEEGIEEERTRAPEGSCSAAQGEPTSAVACCHLLIMLADFDEPRGVSPLPARWRRSRASRGGMALRATALRRLAPALASAGVALAWREQSHTAAEPAQQRLFSCGVLRPSDAGDKVTARAPPSEAAFWASKGLRVVNMSYGQHHAAAVDHHGGVWAWASSEPTPRQLPCRSRIASVASTDASLYAVTSKGKVLEWRDLFSADASADALALPSAEPRPLGGCLAKVTATSVAAGANHVLIVGKKGELVGLGDNRRGQLGLGAPEERPGCTEPTLLGPFASPVVAAACGGGHSVVALADGSCLSFGDDRHLQLGVRSTSIKDLRRGHDQQGGSTLSTPRRVEQMQGRHVTKVAAGGGGKDGGHTAFVVRGEVGDEVWMCGHGRWGQLGSKRFDHISE